MSLFETAVGFKGERERPPPSPEPLAAHSSQKRAPSSALFYCPRAGHEAMATASHYRKLAEECFEWAHDARDVTVRQHYAKLCQIWLECAAQAELRSRVITSSKPKTVQKVA